MSTFIKPYYALLDEKADTIKYCQPKDTIVYLDGNPIMIQNIKQGDIITYIEDDIFSSMRVMKMFKFKYKPSYHCTGGECIFTHDCNRESGGCIHGDSIVQTSNGLKLVRELRKGDKVYSMNGEYVRIKYILKTIINGKCIFYRDINGLMITGMHPIFLNGTWQHPKDVSSFVKVEIDTDYYYSFAVEDSNSSYGTNMIVNGIPVITLAHFIQNDKVATHSYYGTMAVIHDMTSNVGTDDDNICIVHPCNIHRDSNTNMIIGMFSD